MLQHRPSLLEPVLDAHPDVLGNALRFLLGDAGHDRDEELSLSIHRIDIFLLEQDRDAEGFQLSDVLQAVQCISGKTTDRFCNDHVDLVSLTVLDHLLELLSFLCAGSGDAFVCVDACKRPCRISIDELRVMADLCLIA